jgi:hypothetical protein
MARETLTAKGSFFGSSTANKENINDGLSAQYYDICAKAKEQLARYENEIFRLTAELNRPKLPLNLAEQLSEELECYKASRDLIAPIVKDYVQQLTKLFNTQQALEQALRKATLPLTCAASALQQVAPLNRIP